MDCLELSARLKRGDALTLLDVRQPQELEISRLPGRVLNIPLSDLPARLHDLDRDVEIVVYCRSGNRSAQAAALLGGAGFRRVWSLKGGINEWARRVDPHTAEY